MVKKYNGFIMIRYIFSKKERYVMIYNNEKYD